MCKIVFQNKGEEFVLFETDAPNAEETVHQFMVNYGLYHVPLEVSSGLLDKLHVETKFGRIKLNKVIEKA